MKKAIWCSLFLAACSVDRSIDPVSKEEQTILKAFQNLSAGNSIQIADEEEPGERLMLCLTITRKEDQIPVPNQTVKLYHTSISGKYQPSDPNDESTARLNGTATTDSKGRVFVETILPGDYGSSPDNRHIHTSISSANPVGYDIHFKQYTGFMSKRFVSGSDQHFLADLKQLPDGTLVAFVNIEAKRIQQ